MSVAAYTRVVILLVLVDTYSCMLIHTVDSIQHIGADTHTGRLRENWILVSDKCNLDALIEVEPYVSVGVMSTEVESIWNTEQNCCFAVKLVMGTSVSMIGTLLNQYIYNECVYEKSGTQTFENWMMRMLRVEITWYCFDNEFSMVHIYWRDDNTYTPPHTLYESGSYMGTKVVSLHCDPLGRRIYGPDSDDDVAISGHVEVGHVFDVYSDLGKWLGNYTFTHDTVVVVGGYSTIGDPVSPVEPTSVPSVQNIHETLVDEYRTVRNVMRWFTETGFSKIQLPEALWSSIDSYYFNNRNRTVVEQWEGGSMFNWWEARSHLVEIPFSLRELWTSEVQALVSDWINNDFPLEGTSLYGIRLYENNSRLLMHGDTMATHALSVIINVDQQDLLEPWPLQIVDHSGMVHEVDLQPGELLFYESAKCLHGRMKPLRGRLHAGLFIHYRPIGDPMWYTRDYLSPRKMSADNSNGDESVARSDMVCLEATCETDETYLKCADDVFSLWKSFGESA